MVNQNTPKKVDKYKVERMDEGESKSSLDLNHKKPIEDLAIDHTEHREYHKNSEEDPLSKKSNQEVYPQKIEHKLARKGESPTTKDESSTALRRGQDEDQFQNIPQLGVPKKIPKKTVEIQKIEHILSENLEQFYHDLPLEEQQLFKAAGEDAAGKIDLLVRTAKVTTIKLIEIIKSWLKIIPGMDKWFIEQEAKIKADKVIRSQKK